MYLRGFGQDSTDTTDIMGPTLQEAAGGPVIPLSPSTITFPWWLIIAAVLMLAVSKNSRR